MKDFVLESYLRFSAACGGGDFLGLPKWHKYLEGEGSGVDCSPVLNGIGDIWLIVMAIIELLLRIAAIVAVVYVVIGGFKFITSRGNPDKINSARNTLQDGLIGLVIAIIATAVVSFIARSFEDGP